MTTLADYKPLIIPIFRVKKEECILCQNDLDILEELYKNLQQIGKTWTSQSIFQTLQTIMFKHNVKMGRLNRLLMGKEKGLPLNECLFLMGWVSVQKRILYLKS